MNSLDDVNKEWAQDGKIDPTEAGLASLRIPELHHKYLKALGRFKLKHTAQLAKIKRLEKLKYEYYGGTLAHEDLKEQNWEPYNGPKLLKADLEFTVSHDSDIIEESLKLAYFKEIADTLNEIIRNINSRNFQIKNYIDYLKWSQGS
jgi:hypothetical protein